MFPHSKNLTWRDMQHLVVQTSKPAHLNANDWVTNGVGRKGIGVLGMDQGLLFPRAPLAQGCGGRAPQQPWGVEEAGGPGEPCSVAGRTSPAGDPQPWKWH